VIYICAHSAEGAMGIVLNRPAADLSMPDLLVQLEIVSAAERARLPHRVSQTQVLMGGPVETSRGFVLHSPDYHIAQSTLPIDDSVCLTATIDILRAIARGEGPSNAVLALGYAGWTAGQLESEIQANGWLTCPADAEMIFKSAADVRYELAMRKIGIEPAMLSMVAGHA
jgi:putative transcriptional regulator